MLMMKRRPEWRVRLYPSNYKDVKGTYARIVPTGNVTLDELAERLEERTGMYKAEFTRGILAELANLVEDYLLEGKSVSGELGTLMPAVTGLWDFDRIQPSARAKNKAEVRFVPSRRLKKVLKDPLFHRENGRKQGPLLHTVDRFPTNDHWERVMQPDSIIYLTGDRLLMNGDDPTCGFYILDALSGEVRRFFPRNEILLNSRRVIMVKLNGELPPGLYRFRVVSQCTTNSVPLKKPLTGDSPVPYRIYPEGEEYVVVNEGKKII